MEQKFFGIIVHLFDRVQGNMCLDKNNYSGKKIGGKVLNFKKPHSFFYLDPICKYIKVN